MRASDGVREVDSLSSEMSVTQAAAQNAFYDCISEQAHKLVAAGASVAIEAAVTPASGTSTSGTSVAGTSSGLALLSAVLDWADIAPDASHASIVLELAPGNGPDACSGFVVVASAGGLR